VIIGTIGRMTDDGKSIAEQLDELGAQLDWVREYL
jgi:hypothetical protein